MNHRKRQVPIAVLTVFAATAVLLLWGARGLLPAAWANGGGGGTSYVLTLEIHGAGTVHLDPPDETYSDDTSKSYAKDKQVTLTATPSSGWYFSHWEGNVSGSGLTRTITMSSNKMAVAIFKQPTLTVHKQGTGQVQVYVQGSPPGETLTQTFSRSYPVNASVVLIAHPPTGWAFLEWTGDASGTSPSKIIGLSADKTVTAIFEPINLTVNMDPAGAGSVNVTPPNQTDDEPFTVTFAGAVNSQEVVVSASPVIGWAFKEWTGDHTGTDNPATFYVDGEEEVTAVFEEVELTVDTEGKGVVHIDPPDVTPEEEEYPYTEKYATADPQDPPKVDLTASPTDANWGFKEWTGDVELPADTAAIEVEMDAAKSVTAVFDQVEVTITVEGNGSVSTAPTGEAISETKKGFAYGAEVGFTATPDPGWAFKEWTGIITGAEATTTSEPILEDASVTAVFEQIALTVDTQGTGKVTISPPIVTPDVEEYPHTEVYPLSTPENPQSVTLTAVEVANWGFKEWTGDVEGPTNIATTQVDMDAAKSVTAVFEQAVLTTSKEGDGTIGTSPAGEVLSATTKGFRPGDPNAADPITIEAVPGAEWGFKEWTGAINTSDNPAPIEMDSDQSVTAVFYQNTLTVTSGGQGQVSTGGDPQTPTFTEDFKPGKQVDLEAHPEDGWFFAGWSGGAGGTSTTVQVTMTEDKTVHALFERIELTVEKQGEGTVTASPPGGQISVPFTEGYGTGDPVTLHATPAPGWGFKQWMGEVTPSGATATTTMHSSKTVTAIFAQATLDVDKEGEGMVSINLPGGVQELPFSDTYAYNSNVALNATPESCWEFDHWEGNVPSGHEQDNPLSLPMNSNRWIKTVFKTTTPDEAKIRGFHRENMNPNNPSFVEEWVEHLEAVVGDSITIAVSSASPGVEYNWDWDHWINSDGTDANKDGSDEFTDDTDETGLSTVVTYGNQLPNQSPSGIEQKTVTLNSTCLESNSFIEDDEVQVVLNEALIVDTDSWSSAAPQNLAYMEYLVDYMSGGVSEEAIYEQLNYHNIFQITSHGAPGVCSWDESAMISPLGVKEARTRKGRPSGGPRAYLFVFLNSCSGAALSSGITTWMDAWNTQSFLGWSGLTPMLVADEFDSAFWDRVQDGESTATATANAMLDYSVQAAYIITSSSPQDSHAVCTGNVSLTK